MSGSPALTTALTRHLYESVRDPALWPYFLGELRAAVGASNIASIQHTIGGTGAVQHFAGLDPAEVCSYVHTYSAINPWLPKQDRQLSGRALVVAEGETLLSLEEVKKTEFYSAWGRRNHVVHSAIAPVSYAGSQLLYLAANRGEHSGCFDPWALGLLSDLLPHLRNAFSIQDALRRQGTFRGFLNMGGQAVVFLGPAGKVLDMTAGAESCLRNKHSALTVTTGGDLRPACQSDKARINSAFASVMASEARVPVMIRIAGPETASGYGLIFARLPESASPIAASNRASAAMIIVPQADSHWPRWPAAMSSAYGLTAGETELLEALVEHETLTEACQARGVSRNTGKTQLAGIFRKTGTTRQSSLLLLVSRLIVRLGDAAGERHPNG